MKIFAKTSLYAAALICSTALAGSAFAQTATINSSVNVSNSISMSLANGGLNFGVLALVPGSDGVAGTPTDEDMGATATVSAAGVLSAAPVEAGQDTDDVDAVAEVVDDSAATAAILQVTDAVDSATLNFTIDNVTAPQAGFNTLSLDNFPTTFNGGNAGVRTLSGGTISWTETFNASFGSGTNVLRVGGEITAAEGATINQATPYTGSFDVTVSY